MKTKFIPSGWLDKEGRRLDCGPYLSGAIEAKLLLEKLAAPKKPLHELTSGHDGGIYNGPQFVRNYVNDVEYGVPFLTSSSMLLADLSKADLLRRRDAISTRLAFLRLEPGMTLISCSGTIGRMVYARPDMESVWSSQDILKVVPDESKILPGYLYTFLASRYGVPMVVGGTYGAIIQHIEPEHISKLPVPIPPDSIQRRVNALMDQAARLRADASARLATAVRDLEESLGLPRLSTHQGVKTPDISMVSSAVINGRMDSVFHSNYHGSALNPLTALPAGSRTTVGDLAESIVEPGRFRRVPIEDGPSAVPFFGTSAIMRIDPDPAYNVSRRSSIAGYAVDDVTLLTPRSGQLVGIIGHVVLPYGDVIGGAVTEDAIRIKAPDTKTAGYLFVALSSEYGRRQLKSRAFGSSIPHLDVASIRQTVVPLTSGDRFKKIGELGYSVAQNRHEGIKLEREARQIVEAWIAGDKES